MLSVCICISSVSVLMSIYVLFIVLINVKIQSNPIDRHTATTATAKCLLLDNAHVERQRKQMFHLMSSKIQTHDTIQY